MNSSVISYYPNIRATKNGKDMPVDVFLQYVQDGKWQDEVLAVRTGAQSKSDLPYVTLSGKFNERKISGLLKHSGYLCMDIDDVDDPEMLKSILGPDKYVYAAFVSVSGKGLAVMFKINPEKHLEAFEGLQQYLFETYEVITDPSCKDVSRPRYVSWDPHIYMNQHAEKFAIYPKKQKALSKVPDVVYVQSDFDQIIAELVQRHIDITGDYHQWLRLAFALVDKFGEGGRTYFHHVSQFHPQYNTQLCDRQYTNCLKAKKSGVTIATFYYYAKQAGIQIASEKTRIVTQTAALAKKGRRTAKDTVQLLKDVEGIDDAEDIVNQVFTGNVPMPSDDNQVEALEQWLRQNYRLQRNILTRYIENHGRQLQAKDLNTIYVTAKKIFDKLTFDMLDRVINSDFTPDYNPLIDYLHKHAHRTPTGSIQKLFSTIETDTGVQGSEFYPEYALHFGRKWLVGMISSVFGTHSPLMLVLSGEKQGTGKTEWWRRLLPHDLRSFYAESKLDAGKDDNILMTQKLIIMDDEMSGKSKKEADHLKTMLSTQTFSLREPYGRNNVDLQRLAVLCGTTNSNQILNDPTGNRRIIPINVLGIDHEAYNKIDKTDVLIEAYYLYKSGFKWELSSDDVRILNRNTGYFEQSSPEFDLLTKNYEMPNEANKLWVSFMSATEIKSALELRTGQKLNPVRLGMELRKAGFERVARKIHGQMVRGYEVVESKRG